MISIELQISLFLPILLRFRRRYGIEVYLSVIVCSLWLYIIYEDPFSTKFPICRLWQFVFGVLIYDMEDKAKNNSDNNNISVDIIAKIEKSLLGSLKFFKLLFACCFFLFEQLRLFEVRKIIYKAYTNSLKANFSLKYNFCRKWRIEISAKCASHSFLPSCCFTTTARCSIPFKNLLHSYFLGNILDYCCTLALVHSLATWLSTTYVHRKHVLLDVFKSFALYTIYAKAEHFVFSWFEFLFSKSLNNLTH